MSRRSHNAPLFSLVLATALMLFLAACSSGEPAAPTTGSADGGPETGENTVTISSFQFQPRESRVEVGAEVTWTNDDDITHTVTSGTPAAQGVPGVSDDGKEAADGEFEGELDRVDATYSATFDEAGTYPYFCAIHQNMTGSIVVS
ncbi:MAG: plastocyanin/azurin family copper-binding protein [Actinomycetota bacterium]